MICPICKQEVLVYYEVDTDEAFTAYNPLSGLRARGPYDVPKEVKCIRDGFVHFDCCGEERLVKMLRVAA